MGTPPDPSHDDPSLAALAILKNREVSQRERVDAFEQLLTLEGGWWGRGRLMQFALAYALASARTFAENRGGRPDALDWESAAQESLMILATKAAGIASDPKDWLKGVIRNRLRNELRRSAHDIFAVDLPRDLSAGNAEDETSRAAETALLSHYDQLVAAIQGLPPTLRIVSQMWILDHQSAPQIADALGLSQPTTRKRMSRAKSALIARLSVSVVRTTTHIPERLTDWTPGSCNRNPRGMRARANERSRKLFPTCKPGLPRKTRNSFATISSQSSMRA